MMTMTMTMMMMMMMMMMMKVGELSWAENYFKLLTDIGNEHDFKETAAIIRKSLQTTHFFIHHFKLFGTARL